MPLTWGVLPTFVESLEYFRDQWIALILAQLSRLSNPFSLSLEGLRTLEKQ
jgi:hypothetical protein